jgi:hypothetical protein
MSNRLEKFVNELKRRFVETFGGNNRSSINLSLSDTRWQGKIPIQAPGALGTLEFPRGWIMSLFERRSAFEALGLDGKSGDDLLLLDLTESIECSAKVVLTLWSALESHWGLSLKRDHAENWQQLIRSALWYVPLCGEEQQFIPFLKYQLSYLFAKGEGQAELPERPGWMDQRDGSVLLDWLGRFFKSRCFGWKLKNIEWRNTVLHGIKKGLPQMGFLYLKKNCEAMKARLTKKCVSPKFILKAVARTAREIFPKGIIEEDWNQIDPYLKISDHACYETNRSAQGVLGNLYFQDMGRFEALRYGKRSPYGWSRNVAPDQLGAMLWDPSNGVTKEIRYPNWLPDQIYAHLQRRAVTGPTGLWTSVPLGQDLPDFPDEMKGSAAVKPIFEPLKIRMISAGDVDSNGLYSRLQKTLWSGLQKFTQFRLTGKSVDCSDVEWVRSQTLLDRDSNISDFSMWVSGDYSAATDNLHGDCSREAIRAIAGDPTTMRVLEKGLTDTLIDFSQIDTKKFTSPEMFVGQSLAKITAGIGSMDDGELPGPFRMTNGQLMGSVFSFPILCLINLAVYRECLEQYSKRIWKLRDLPVLCNGDDILFLANSEFYKLWCDIIGLAGFEKSIGKNYLSASTAVINSTYFRAGPERAVTKVPYLNMGWCTGVTKGGGGFDGEDELEYPIDKIGAQVEMAHDQWALCAEVNEYSADLSPKDLERRRQVFQRYREEIRLWNWDRVLKTGAIAGGGPCGLGLTETTTEERLKFSYWAAIHREKRVQKGLTSLPKTLIPWKIAQCSWNNDYNDLVSQFRKVGKRLTLDRVLSTFYTRESLTVYRRFEESRFSVGAI